MAQAGNSQRQVIKYLKREEVVFQKGDTTTKTKLKQKTMNDRHETKKKHSIKSRARYNNGKS